MTPILDQQIEEAQQAFAVWKETPVTQRVLWLKAFQKILQKKSDEIIQVIQEETKKPAAEAFNIEIAAVIMTADYYRKKSKAFLKERRAETEWLFKNKAVLVRRVPHGVVGIIGPSNLPFALTIGDAIPALMAGNAVIIKPSEFTPKSAQKGLELAMEASLPQGLLQVATGGAETGAELVEKSDCIFFTGSTAVGKIIAKKSAELLKPCILELGGKAPLLVLEDADLKRAARACVWGRFAHSGQHCIAIERVYVAKKIFQPFVEKVIEETKKIGREELSPLTLPQAAPRIQAMLAEAQGKGAAIVYQSPLGPTILTNVNHTMQVMREESFGPLLPIMAFETVEEAIRLANDSSSGLSATVFSQNLKQAAAVAKQIEAGNISINDVMDHFMVMDAPFSGWKQSGIGTRHSKEGLLQFTKPQTIFRHRFPLPLRRHAEFWWFPYRPAMQKLMRGLIHFFFG
ncbi:MAG: aldehyde dehydrogenase family protein [Deltaproteobacteria bacterium]|nr:aldehyde dehydrogenase family protein [Deltaproteobacteria bacterium]